MQNNMMRFLGPVLKRARHRKHTAFMALREGFSASPDQTDGAEKRPVRIPHEFTGKGYVSFLLHIDAEIEHGLMLQYLYAAYSLGGPQVPEQFRDKVRAWQEIILGIAKEEMGHFITVQNVLRLIGAPLHFERQDYPWDTPFYPFPFRLEPLTLESLAKYVFAESPENWIYSDDPVAREIKEMVFAEDSDPHRVGALFQDLLQLIKDPEVIADEVFQADTYPYQAKFDEWGRGYTGGDRGNATRANPAGSPDVLVMALATRDDAVSALSAIAEQGEATSEGDAGPPSHFERFLTIYREMQEMRKGGVQPARNVAVNPYVDSFAEDESASPSEGQTSDEDREEITHPEAKLWAHLFNLRYRLLLNYLSHSFQLEGGLNNTGERTPRATIINATFGEMYNLRSIAHVLVQLPLAPTGDRLAGPPFLVPYTLQLPAGEHNRWREHKDVLTAAGKITDELLALPGQSQQRYLHALRDADRQLMQIVDKLTTPALV